MPRAEQVSSQPRKQERPIVRKYHVDRPNVAGVPAVSSTYSPQQISADSLVTPVSSLQPYNNSCDFVNSGSFAPSQQSFVKSTPDATGAVSPPAMSTPTMSAWSPRQVP